MARCPAHDDKNPSLAIAEGDDGRALLTCHAGCATAAVVEALGLTMADLFPLRPPKERRRSDKPADSDSSGQLSRGGLTLARYAEHFSLPIEFLRNAGLEDAMWQNRPVVKIPYRNEVGNVVATRYRIGLTGDRFRWATGSKPQLYGLPGLVRAREAGHVLVVEGESDVHVATFLGLPAVGVPGAKTWKDEWAAYFDNIPRVFVLQEPDQGGEQLVEHLANSPPGRRPLWVVHLPGVKDVAELYRRDPEIVAELIRAAMAEAVPIAATSATAPDHPVAALTVAEALSVFQRWLHMPDPTPILATWGAVAANYLDGDPVWLGLVAPPSSAKTEILISLYCLPTVHPASTLTPAALLSGTPKKQRAKNASGGLLRQMGDFGIIVMKDFGSVLSERSESQSEILAALREIYDGRWTRHLGTDGGLTLDWEGKAGFIFGVTPALDDHHAVMGSMGERFVLIRFDSSDEEAAFRALDHDGERTAVMRKELAETVEGLFAGRRSEPRHLSEEERVEIVKLASLAVRLRSTVTRDRSGAREITNIHGVEGAPRLTLVLVRLLAGLDVLGVEREQALGVIRRVALDSIPPIRLRVFRYLKQQNGSEVATTQVSVALGLPRTTTTRTLEELAAYSVVAFRKDGNHDTAPYFWKLNPQYTEQVWRG
jgi:hypothetical protein